MFMERMIRAAAVTLLSVWIALLSACSSSTTSNVDRIIVVDPIKERLSGDQLKLSSDYLGNLLGTLNEGKLTADALTADFRRKAAPPRPGNEDDRKQGFDILRMAEYLREVNNGRYPDAFIFHPSPTGPFALGEVTVDGGKEGYLLHLVPTDGATGWRINWLHRSTVYNNLAAGNPGQQPAIGPVMAAVKFAENLLGGDIYLAEAVLSPGYKQKQYAEVVPVDQGIGFNRPAVHKMIKGWRGEAADYLLGAIDPAADGSCSVEVITLDKDKKPVKAFTLKVVKADPGDWLIDDVELKEVK